MIDIVPLCWLPGLAVLLGFSGIDASGGNRIWWGDVLLVGPVAEAHFDCGEDGDVRLVAALVAGERRTVSLPFPVRSPLGTDGLSSVPVPRVSLRARDGSAQEPGSPGSVEWIGWSAEQTSERFDRLSPALRGRSRPIPGARSPQPGAAALALALGTFLVGFANRRRVWVALSTGLAGAAALLLMTIVLTPVERRTRVHEIDLGLAQSFVVEAGRSATLPARRVEVAPEHTALRFELSLSGDDVVGTAAPVSDRSSSESVRIFAFQSATVTPWSRGGNPDALAAAWVRSQGGRWTAHGAWPPNTPLGPRTEGEAPAPGWLSAGLPPGRGVLLGRVESSAAGAEGESDEGLASFVRVLGFR